MLTLTTRVGVGGSSGVVLGAVLLLWQRPRRPREPLRGRARPAAGLPGRIGPMILLLPLLPQGVHGGLADLLEGGDGGLAHGAAYVVQDLAELHHADAAVGALGHLDGMERITFEI